MAHKVVLDASAIVALVLRENGMDVIRKIITSGVAVTTPTGLAEALITCRRKGYQGSRDDLAASLVDLGLDVVPMVEADGVEMAFLLERSDDMATDGGTRADKVGRLSLGDAACLAVAHRLDLTAVVSDGTWEVLNVPGLRIQPFR